MPTDLFVRTRQDTTVISYIYSNEDFYSKIWAICYKIIQLQKTLFKFLSVTNKSGNALNNYTTIYLNVPKHTRVIMLQTRQFSTEQNSCCYYSLYCKKIFQLTYIKHLNINEITENLAAQYC